MDQQEEREVLDKVIEYIKTLPDGVQLSMRDALQHFDRDSSDLPSSLNYCVLDEVCAAIENGTDIILDFSAHDGLVEGLPFAMNFIVCRKKLQSVKIVSNLIGYGPRPKFDTPAEQRLTISATGRYWFSEYLFGNGEYPHCTVGRKEQGSIGKEKAYQILSLIKDYTEQGELLGYATDIGDWKMFTTELDGSHRRLDGSLDGGVHIDGISLEEFIKERIPLENMVLFGELDEEALKEAKEVAESKSDAADEDANDINEDDDAGMIIEVDDKKYNAGESIVIHVDNETQTSCTPTAAHLESTDATMDDDPFADDDFHVYVYCLVKLSSIDEPIYYRTEDRTLRRGDHVIVPKPGNSEKVTGEIISVEHHMRFSVPVPVEMTRVIVGRDA
ncbi:MAG: hypothetical protein LUH57_01835 [Ruminococcus sp.]|nr:hypothetical protein [Ruminococcus sp.]